MPTQRNRLLSSVVGLTALGVLIAGCAGQSGGSGAASPAQREPQPPKVASNESDGMFEPYRDGAAAVTYDSAQVPAGAQAKVNAESEPDGQTKITLTVTGLQPNRAYGGHVHTKRCGPTGEAAGPHFQQKADPVKPSVDPAYANPQNEVWLDFHTDARGNGTATAQGRWDFDTHDAKSVVIHESHTHTEPGKAGQAGARLACLNIDL